MVLSKLVYDLACRRSSDSACRCDSCRERSEEMRCQHCLLVSYCSETCQQEHWHYSHRAMCRTLTGLNPVMQRRRRKRVEDLAEEDLSVDWEYCKKIEERSKLNICNIYWSKFHYHTNQSQCDCKSVSKGTATIFDKQTSNLHFPFKIGEVKEEFDGAKVTGVDAMIE